MKSHAIYYLMILINVFAMQFGDISIINFIACVIIIALGISHNVIFDKN